MKIERLSENQLRFTVWSNDLPEGGITIAELAGDSEKTEELVKYMMEKAKEEFGFETEQQPIVIEAIPVNKDCIVFLVTKVDEENPDSKYSYIQKLKQQAMDMARSLKTGEIELGGEAENEEEDVLSRPVDDKTGKVLPYMIYTADDLEKFITVANISRSYYDSDNTLYKSFDDKTYFLVVHHNRNTPQEFQYLCESLGEFAVPYKFNYATKYYIDEHYRKIIEDNALQTLAEL